MSIREICAASDQIHEELSSVYQLGSNAAKNMELSIDLEILTEIILNYIKKTDPNYKFVDFYDEKFTDSFKELIKNQEEFKKILIEQKMSIEEFIKIRCLFSTSLFYNSFNKIY